MEKIKTPTNPDDGKTVVVVRSQQDKNGKEAREDIEGKSGRVCHKSTSFVSVIYLIMEDIIMIS